MNSKIPLPFENGSSPSHAADSLEETLRLLAHAPVPEGLAERVQAALQNPPRAGRVLSWPRRLALENGWMRAAAAAAIVFVVAGGGWGVYSRVRPAGPTAGAVTAPPRAVAPGGFSSAGAIRTPQTLNGPVLTHPLAPRPVENMSKTAGKGGPAQAASARIKPAGKSPLPAPQPAQ